VIESDEEEEEYEADAIELSGEEDDFQTPPSRPTYSQTSFECEIDWGREAAATKGGAAAKNLKQTKLPFSSQAAGRRR
jgi:hypothetical protein